MKLSWIYGKRNIKNEINTLKKGIKNDHDNDEYYIKLISIMVKGNLLINGYRPVDSQIIAVLLFLYKEKNYDIIEEISTGEGKTIIISFNNIKIFSR